MTEQPAIRIAAARDYLAAGLSLVPIKLDGSKSPWDRSWKHLMTARLDPAQADVIFADFGIGIIGGAVSGNLEIIDCDNEAIGREFLRLLEAMCPEILEKLTIVKTPRPGLHLYYRCKVPVSGNVGLAFESQKVKLIEKKSERGYVLAPGNPPEAHPTGRTYEQIYGPPLTELVELTEAERETLLTWARSLSRWVQEAPTPTAFVPRSDADRDRVQEFCERATWQWILESAGWTFYKSTSDKTYWTRPGKISGVSASTGLQGSDLRDLLRVFSSSTPFDTSRCYNKFAAYALLQHRNDWGAAIKQAIELRLIDDLPQQSQDYGVNIDHIMAAGSGDGAAQLPAGPPVKKASWTPLAAHNQAFLDRITNRRPHPRYDVGLPSFFVGPGAVTLIGAGPGTGKTTLVQQLVTSALSIDQSLRSLILSVELSGEDLLEKQASIWSGVPAWIIRGYPGMLTEQQISEIRSVVDELTAINQRMVTLDLPHYLDHLHGAVTSFDPHIVVLDYLQRIRRTASDRAEPREVASHVMSYARQLALDGRAVILVSALRRTTKGAGYSDLDITSFRDSSEIEFGADEAYAITRQTSEKGKFDVAHLKARFRRVQDFVLEQSDSLRFSEVGTVDLTHIMAQGETPCA